MTALTLRTLPPQAPSTPAHASVDVAVYGATPGGITAAIEARRKGRTVLIFGGWREIQLGGMMTGGLGGTDLRNRAALGGLGLEFFQKVWAHYNDLDQNQNLEPSVAHKIFQSWCAEEGVQYIWTKGVAGASKDGTRLRKIVTLDGITVEARQWIDSSYEGDLLRVAGATLRTGRESRAEFGEHLAGVQLEDAKHNWAGYYISPHRRAGDPASGLLPDVSASVPPVGTGSPTDTQAFNFRLCMTKTLSNAQPLPTSPPPGYDPSRFELMLRYLKARADAGLAVTRSSTMAIMNVLPNGKLDVNANGPFSTDAFGLSAAYITPDYQQRERAWKAIEAHVRGFLWTLWAHPDARVSADLRASMRALRLTAGEYPRTHPNDLPGWSPQLYVREYARLRGEYIMTEHDTRRADNQPVPYAGSVVALGSYWLDSHHIQRVALQRGDGSWYVYNEGGLFLDVGGSNRMVPIPYGCLLPRRHELTNVSTTWSLSLTHCAMGLVRMEATSMCIGHAAGLAAAMATASPGDVALQDINVAELRSQLLSEGAAINAA
ncbi:FAD-dependent oxidoreductase [Muricoccus aerilatus]|uniref:FAD-dependent oxidoreductase n=1 Tax=Muricoccus aerilatus TaxID=452982 RepID=UPI0005C19340|nr:FAD-dependent oxidoreductase [Roseomonas aerilata]